MRSYASTCADRSKSAAFSVVGPSKRRPGGKAPRKKLIIATMLISFNVTQVLHAEDRRRTASAAQEANRSAESARAQKSVPSHAGCVKCTSVTSGSISRSRHPEAIAAYRSKASSS